MSSPTISIVIPVYLPNRYLQEVFQSIREQTYKNFEIVISDDSPDQEPARHIISQFSDLPIRYVRNKAEKGIFNNLNNAIQNSTGAFVQIFCQDDVMKSNFLEEQLKTFSGYPTAGLVFSGLDEIDANGNLIASSPFFSEPLKTWNNFLPKNKALNYLFAYGCIPRNLSPVMLRREVIEQVGLFRQSFSFAGDYDYWIRVAEKFDFAMNKAASLQVRTHTDRASKTIGMLKLIPDVTTLLRLLYHSNTTSATKTAKYLQVNNLVVGHFKEIVLHVAAGRFRYLRLLKYLQSPPFSINTILFLIFQRYYKRKISWFIREDQC